MMVMRVEDRLGCLADYRGTGSANPDADPNADGMREHRGNGRGRCRWWLRRCRYRNGYSGRTGATSGCLVIEYRHPDQSLSCVCHIRGLQFGGQLSFPLVATILEPDLHLCLRQSQGGSETRPFGRRQIAFHVERRFQLKDLRSREHRARLLLPLYATGIPRV